MSIDIFGTKRNVDKMALKDRGDKIRRDLEDLNVKDAINRDGAKPITHGTITGDGRVLLEREDERTRAMAKFRKKPVVIEAVQYTGKSACHKELLRVFGREFMEVTTSVPMLVVRTLEGDMRANVGDWIIKGIKGEFYPCKPDIFEATYEPVKDDKP